MDTSINKQTEKTEKNINKDWDEQSLIIVK